MRRAQGRFRDGRVLSDRADQCEEHDENPAHDAARRRPAALDRFLHRRAGHALLRTTDRPEQKYTLAFVGYGDESQGAVLELTYNYGVDRYELGTGFGHVAIEVDDAAAACAAVKAKGGKVTREAGREGRHDGDRVRRGPRWLQDRIDRASAPADGVAQPGSSAAKPAQPLISRGDPGGATLPRATSAAHPAVRSSSRDVVHEHVGPLPVARRTGAAGPADRR